MGVLKFKILVDPSLVITIIYLVCLIYSMGVEKKILKRIMHFRYMTYMTTSQQKNLCPGGYKINKISRSFIRYCYYIFSLTDLHLRVEKILKEAHQFYNLYPKIISPWVFVCVCVGGGGVMKFALSCLLTLHMKHTKLFQIVPLALEEKMLTHFG